MPDDTSPSACYRQLAREALAAAYALSEGENRDALLQMAQAWERLADQYADSTGPLSSSQGEQPVVQQQQQVHPDDDKKK